MDWQKSMIWAHDYRVVTLASTLTRTSHGCRCRGDNDEGAPGRFYLDVPSWQALRRMRRRVIFILIGVVLLVLAFVLFTSQGRAPR